MITTLDFGSILLLRVVMAGVEIREGFLCPICVQDLGSVIQLQDHFELVHAGEDRAVLNQLKGNLLCPIFISLHIRVVKTDQVL